MKFGIISCGKKKKRLPYKAKNLYTGTYTRMKIKYAEQNLDEYWILSAKYGLVRPETFLHPYDVPMSDVDNPVEELDLNESIEHMNVHVWDRNTEVYLLMGQTYKEALPELPEFLDVIDPFKDTAGIGEQLSWLSERVE